MDPIRVESQFNESTACMQNSRRPPARAVCNGEGLGTLELDTEWREKRVSGVQRWRRVSKLQTSGKISTYQSRGSEDVLPTTPPMHLQITQEYRNSVLYRNKTRCVNKLVYSKSRHLSDSDPARTQTPVLSNPPSVSCHLDELISA